MSNLPTDTREPSVTLLQTRAIEVEVAHAFHSVLIEQLGESAARDIFQEAVTRLAKASAEEIRKECPQPGLEDLWRVWESLAADGHLDIDLVESSANRLHFHVSRCAFAEMYTDRDRVETGLAFSCGRDASFAHSLIPGVHMKQSHTILEGARRCEITYTLEGR